MADPLPLRSLQGGNCKDTCGSNEMSIVSWAATRFRKSELQQNQPIPAKTVNV